MAMTRAADWAPGVAARTGVLVAAVVCTAAADGWRLAAAASLCLAGAVFLHPAGFRVLRRPAVWAFLALLAVPPLVFSTPRDVVIAGGLAVSSDGGWLAAAVLTRAIVIAVATAGFAATVSPQAFSGLLEWCGLRGLGFSVGVAINTLPLATRTWSTSARALRLRGGFRAHKFRDAVLLVMTVIGNALRHADEVVEAAQARGYSPGVLALAPPARWRTDLVWLTTWAMIAGLVFTLRA